MYINVSVASTLFKENGHDLKGIFQLFYNAVTTDYLNKTCVVNNAPSLDGNYTTSIGSYDLDRIHIKGHIADALENFAPNVEFAQKRIQQFDEDYKKLRELTEKLGNYGFWTILFRTNKRVRVYLRQKEEIEAMKISIEDLLQIAFYKFTQVCGTQKQFVEGFYRHLKLDEEKN